MRNILFISCFLLTFTVFAQQKGQEQDSTQIPSSIFTLNTLHFNQDTDWVYKPLQLTGYKFMIVDNFNNNGFYNNVHFDLRNFGREVSVEDLFDNYIKSELNNFDVSKNSRHFIWTMWDTSLQKQYQQGQNKN